MSTWPPPPEDRPEGDGPAGLPPSAPPPPPGPAWSPAPPPPPGWGGPPAWSGPAGYGQPLVAVPTGPNPLCIASLVVGALGVFGAFCCFIFGIPLGLAAIVTGIIGLTQVRGGSAQGRGMAIAGICCGVAALILPVAFLLLSFGLGGFGTDQPLR